MNPVSVSSSLIELQFLLGVPRLASKPLFLPNSSHEFPTISKTLPLGCTTITQMSKTKLSIFPKPIPLKSPFLCNWCHPSPGQKLGSYFQLPPLLPSSPLLEKSFIICFFIFFKFVTSFCSCCSLHLRPELLNNFLFDFPVCETQNYTYT